MQAFNTFLVLFLSISLINYCLSKCDSKLIPKSTRCSGCPPVNKKGLPCASTTISTNKIVGACGYGKPNDDTLPDDYWTLTQYTAGINASNLAPNDPSRGWCAPNCGKCYNLCSTGATPNSTEVKPGVCIVVKITDRCGTGWPSIILELEITNREYIVIKT